MLWVVADPRQHRDRIRDGIEAEDAHRAALRPEQTQDVLDERRLARAVGADEAVDRPRGRDTLTLARAVVAPKRRVSSATSMTASITSFSRAPVEPDLVANCCPAASTVRSAVSVAGAESSDQRSA